METTRFTSKKMFYLGLAGLTLFEVLNAFFIVPVPGSQEINSIGIAYFLYRSRWIFRILFGTMMLMGSMAAFKGRKWKVIFPLLWLALCAKLIHMINYDLTADEMFFQPRHLVLLGRQGNKVPGDRLVLTVENNGEAKAFPIEYMAFHHQVLDKIGGRPLMITYCSVCRTGRVYEPIVNGKEETFRLVGMDHFNAMFEDATTKSWWRQTSGEAIAGELKGQSLPEFPSGQMSVSEFYNRYPQGKVMQPDPDFEKIYDPEAKFEKGTLISSLEGTDTASWKNKSWVVGVVSGSDEKAYDWNDLKKRSVINDMMGGKPVAVVLARDRVSFAAFERPSGEPCEVTNDTLKCGEGRYDMAGRGINGTVGRLKKLRAYQEFWHSWKTFHPASGQYSLAENGR